MMELIQPLSLPADPAAVDTQFDAVAVQIDRLSGEIAGIGKYLRIGLAATLRQRAQMLELLEALQEQPKFIPEQNVSAVAQAVLAGQTRAGQTQ